jgi:hypothetical protein
MDSTMESEELRAAAQLVVGPDERIRAAGIFALQDDHAALAAGGIAAAIATPEAAGPLAGGAATALGTEAARQAHARAEGVTERMVIAVSDRAIHVLSMPPLGGRPHRELLSFDRARTEVEVRRFGLSRHLELRDEDSGRRLGLTGSTAPFSPAARGDKAVLAELSGP